MSKDTGGPAFPIAETETRYEHEGMTLLDYFAAAMMPMYFGPDIDEQQAASFCYTDAEAMLAEKRRREAE
jgi:hypothetical protein